MKEQPPISEELLFSQMKPQEASKPLDNEQHEALHGWDVWLEDLFPKMDADKAKVHEIKPWEFRQFEER